LFVFGSRRRKSIKILVYDGQGFVLYQTHVPSFRGSLPGVWGFVELIALGDLGGRSSSGLSSLFLETTSGPVF
jgi:hypothetical protein